LREPRSRITLSAPFKGMRLLVRRYPIALLVLSTLDCLQVALHRTKTGSAAHSRAECRAQFSFLFTLRDGRITEWRIFLRESEALETVRLPE
jgi:hypothetical protein